MRRIVDICSYLVNFVIVGVLTLSLVACSDSKDSKQGSTDKISDDKNKVDKVYVVKFAHVVSSGTPKGKAADLFAKRAEELSNGRLKVEVFPSAQLVDDDKVFTELKRNNVQMAAPSFSKFTPIVKEFNVWDIPFLFRDNEHLHKIMDGSIGDFLKSKVTEKGFVALDYWDSGFKHFSTNKKPIIVPDDAKGQKMRIMSSKILEEQTKVLGATPQVMNFGEVYSALQTGVVDSAENPLSNLYNSKFYEVQNSITLSGHGYLGYLVIVSEKFWKELPDDLKDIFKEALHEATLFEREETQKDEVLLLKNLENYAQKSGKLQIISLTPEQKEQWRNVMVTIYPKFYDVVGEDLITKIQNVE